MRVAHYQLFCTTEGLWQDAFAFEGDPEPTTCPVHTDHDVAAGSTTLQRLIGPDEVSVVNTNGTPANFPSTSDGTPIVQPNVVPPKYFFWGTGAFDDLDPVPPASGRGSGSQISRLVAGLDKTEYIEGQFHENVYIIGGKIGAAGATYKDWISLDVLAPASEPASAPGVGNASKVATPYGFNIIIPAPGNDGDWDVDGSTLTIGELNTGLAPVPNGAKLGFWHWDPEQDPSIFPVDDVNNPDGNYDLYDADIPLARQANRYPLLITGDVTPAASIKGKKILPHWKWKFTVYRNELLGEVSVVVLLFTARRETN